MTISEVMEWIGAACLATAAGLALGPAAALVLVGVALVYFAHVYDETPSAPKPPKAEK